MKNITIKVIKQMLISLIRENGTNTILYTGYL